MTTEQLPIKEVKCTHAGQLGRYQDSVYTYEIHLDEGAMSEEEILTYCFNHISKHKMQSKEEWRTACGDLGKYFAGYYELTKMPYGYKYSTTHPYTD